MTSPSEWLHKPWTSLRGRFCMQLTFLSRTTCYLTIETTLCQSNRNSLTVGITGRFTYNCIDTHQNWRNLQFSTSSLQCHELAPTWHSPKTLAINKHFQSRSMRRIMIFLLVLLEAAANFTIVDTISTQTRTRTGYIQTANAGGFVCWLVSIEVWASIGTQFVTFGTGWFSWLSWEAVKLCVVETTYT